MRRRRRRACRSRSAMATMPRPKWYCQTRLTITRAVSGLSFDAIQLGQHRPPAARLRALRRLRDRRRRRRRAPPGSPARPRRPATCGLPRTSTYVAGGRDVAVVDRQRQLLRRRPASSSSAVALLPQPRRTRLLLRRRGTAAPSSTTCGRSRALGRPLVLGRHLLDRLVLDRRHLPRRARRSWPAAASARASYVVRFSAGVMSVRLALDADVARVAVAAARRWKNATQPVVVASAGSGRSCGRGSGRS